MKLQQKILKPKLGVLALAKEVGNVSAACKAMGYSRDSYYRFKALWQVLLWQNTLADFFGCETPGY